MTHGKLIETLRQNFVRHLEDGPQDPDDFTSFAIGAFQSAAIQTLVEAYEGGGNGADKALTPQQRAARTRKANQRKRDNAQVRAALGSEEAVA